MSRQARIDECSRMADALRVLHKVAGGVIVIFIEADACPAGFSIPAEALEKVRPELPRILRELASHIESGVIELTVKKETALS
jgi:hypothetical protein